MQTVRRQRLAPVVLEDQPRSSSRPKDIDYRYAKPVEYGGLSDHPVHALTHGLAIDVAVTDEVLSRDPEGRLRFLAEFAQRHPEVPLSPLMAKLFPGVDLTRPTEPAAPPLPTTAPAHWATDKLPRDTPPDFIKRHYGPWLGHGLTRPMVAALDPPLGIAVNNWVYRNGMPDDLDLPKKSEAIDRWIQRVTNPETGDATIPAAAARRFVDALTRRKGRSRGE